MRVAQPVQLVPQVGTHHTLAELNSEVSNNSSKDESYQSNLSQGFELEFKYLTGLLVLLNFLVSHHLHGNL